MLLDNDKPTVSEVLAKLEAMGSFEQLALHFEDQGIVGRISCPESCIVANYLTALTGKNVTVGLTTVHTYADGSLVDTVTYNPLPWNVQQFIELFDEGVFPALLDGDE